MWVMRLTGCWRHVVRGYGKGGQAFASGSAIFLPAVLGIAGAQGAKSTEISPIGIHPSIINPSERANPGSKRQRNKMPVSSSRWLYPLDIGRPSQRYPVIRTVLPIPTRSFRPRPRREASPAGVRNEKCGGSSPRGWRRAGRARGRAGRTVSSQPSTSNALRRSSPRPTRLCDAR